MAQPDRSPTQLLTFVATNNVGARSSQLTLASKVLQEPRQTGGVMVATCTKAANSWTVTFIAIGTARKLLSVYDENRRQWAPLRTTNTWIDAGIT